MLSRQAMLKQSFVLWEGKHDAGEGSRVAKLYRVASPPAVLVLDPQTREEARPAYAHWHAHSHLASR